MTIGLSRRELIILAGAVAALPPAAHAQQRNRLHQIAVLTLRTSEEAATFVAVFRDQLRSLGYAEGQSVKIDYRYAEGDTTRLNQLGRELISLKPEVVLAVEPSCARAIKSIAPSLPIVCIALTDEVIPELAASYARPGGSVTGIAITVEGLMGKLVELTLEIVPKATRVGLLYNPAGASMQLFAGSIEAAASSLGVSVLVEQVITADDLKPAINRLSKNNQALIIPPNGLFQSYRALTMQLALADQMPTIVAEREFVEVGGLASYGVDTKESYRLAAAYVGKILNGSKPGDLPIEFATKLELVINLRTAKALSLTIPDTLLARADDVIE